MTQEQKPSQPEDTAAGDERDPESESSKSPEIVEEDESSAKDVNGQKANGNDAEESEDANETADGDDSPKAVKSEADSESEAPESRAPENEGRAQQDDEEKEGSLLPWVIGIVVILAAELFIYGHDGHIQVCVGQEGVTDFALVGQGRTRENARKLPVCAERMNLGMWGSSEEQSRAALRDACTRAARFVRQTPQACLRNDGKWTRRVQMTQVAPWDARLYRRLLWLD